MAALSNPSEIAREVLRQLAVRRIPPTPDNYFTLYNEIAEHPPGDEPFPEKQCKSLAAALDRSRPAQQRLARSFDEAIRDKSWERFQNTWKSFCTEASSEPPPWSDLIAELIRQWETHHAGLTPGKKRDSLEHVLSSAGKDPDLLFTRLKGLLTSWNQNADAGGTPLADAPETAAEDNGADAVAATTAPASADNALVGELRELFAFTLETAVATQLVESPQLVEEARTLASAVRRAQDTKALKKLLDKLKQFAFRLELLADDQLELRTGLLHLLQLLIENVSELVEDDQWLHGQIEMVRDIVTSPLSLRTIDDAEQRIKEVIFKQSQLKHSLSEAQEALKHMLAGFVDHLADFAETRIIQLNAQRSRDELRATQQRVRESEQRVAELQGELDKASTLVRHDQLTGALNRHGLEEAFAKETARTQRRRTSLCLAILDIDNFKKLNDSLGHDAGDAALIHLITVIKNTMRPTDLVARFGGEEFVILLPDTGLEDSTHALQRLQRELTKHYFMHDNQKLLITFSAGVTAYQPGEDQAAAIKRADTAMYEAKRTGKNRVVTA